MLGQENDATSRHGARLTIFTFLFALATCAYHAQIGLSWVLVLALLVLARPGSVPLFAMLVLAQTAVIYAELPWVNTNRILQFIVGLTLLATLAASLREGHRESRLADRWLELSEAPLRVEFLVLYGWTFFHKLNADFVDPQVSCGVAVNKQMLTLLGVQSVDVVDTFALLFIGATLVAEGGLPVLLTLRKTRHAGLLVAAAFQFIVGVAIFYSFQATMMALLFLFVPRDFPARAENLWQALGPKRGWIVGIAVAVGGVVPALVAVSVWQPDLTLAENLEQAKPAFRGVFWLAWWGMLPLLGISAWLLRDCRETISARALVRPERQWLWVFPLLVLLNGVTPYLGLKTEFSFAMYSNLRTEGGVTNHLLVPGPLSFADYQIDLVQVEESSDPWLEDVVARGYPIPWVMLKRRVWETDAEGAGALAVTYVRHGARRVVPDAHSDPELMEAPSYLERKLLNFRMILPADANRCEH